MPEHLSPGAHSGRIYGRGTHGTRNSPHTDGPKPDVRKVPADSVPFGEDICRRGTSVWAGFDGDKVICVEATAVEARRKWRDYMVKKRMVMQEQKGLTENVEGNSI